MHEGCPYIIRGCTLHDNRPPPGTIIRKSSFNHYATDQVVGVAPSNVPTFLAALAAQYAAGHLSSSDTAGPVTAHPLSAAPNVPAQAPTPAPAAGHLSTSDTAGPVTAHSHSNVPAPPTPAPLAATVPNTPESTPTRSNTPAELTLARSLSSDLRSPSLELSEIDWDEVYAFIDSSRNRGSDPGHSSDCEPPYDPLEFYRSPPPSPTESQIDWPTQSRADKSETVEDVDVDVDFSDIDDINPDDFSDFDYTRPPLWTPPSYRLSTDIQPTLWCDTATALYSQAMLAIELHEARERAAKADTALVVARAAADTATLAAYHAARDCSQDAIVVQDLNAHMVKAEANSLSKAVEAAAAAAAAARAKEAALAAGIEIDDEPGNEVGAQEAAGAANDDDNEVETDEDGFYISTLPWASSGYWCIADQIRVLGEPLSEYLEH